MKVSKAYENQVFIQPGGQKHSNKMRSTFSSFNLKKESLQSSDFHENSCQRMTSYTKTNANDDHHRKPAAYVQVAQPNYQLYEYSMTNLNYTAKNKRKIGKAGRISGINKSNNHDFFSSNSFKSCTDLSIQNFDNNSLYNRINSLLIQLNVNTFQSTFNGILSLGVNNEPFLQTYVNSVFKQAVINPSLSLLYSILSTNIASIMKRTKYGDRMQELFEKKCLESFYLPNETIDKWRLSLLHGVAIFTGNLARDYLIPRSIFTEWTQKLLQDGSVKSLGLLISLISAGGSSLIQDNKLLDKLSSKVSDSNSSDLIETYNSFIQTFENEKSDEEQFSRHMKLLKLKQYPNDDNSCEEQNISLFTRSDSVPLKLSYMASKMTMDEIVFKYIENPSISEFTKLLDDNNFSKNSSRTATELLRSIVKQSDDKIADLLNMFCDITMYQYFNENQIKVAISNVSSENEKDIKVGKSLILVYCHLITEEMISFDDFESLFAPMKAIWAELIPFFFCEIDNQLGSWIEEMIEFDFWRDLKFINSDSAIKQMEILSEWNIIDIFPEYDIAYNYYLKLKCNNKSAGLIFDDIDMTIDNHKLIEILFEILLSLNESQMKAQGIRLKKYFNSFASEIPKILTKFGERGTKLIPLLQ